MIWLSGQSMINWVRTYVRQGVVLLPGAAQLQEKDIAWRLKASQADCIFAGPDTAVEVSFGVTAWRDF